MHISSQDFDDQGPIPAKYTCEGDDISPQLEWTDIPHGTEELLLICEDPDAPSGTFIHWAIRNLSPTGTGLQRGQVPAEAVEGTNDFGRRGFGGPCPPEGHGPHRYYFRLFALRSPLDLPAGFSADEAKAAMQGSVLEEAAVMGTFERKK